MRSYKSAGEYTAAVLKRVLLLLVLLLAESDHACASAKSRDARKISPGVTTSKGDSIPFANELEP